MKPADVVSDGMHQKFGDPVGENARLVGQLAVGKR